MTPTANHIVTENRNLRLVRGKRIELFRNEDVSAQIQALRSQRVERPRFWPMVLIAGIALTAAFVFTRLAEGLL